jgi:hypothetical protein
MRVRMFSASLVLLLLLAGCALGGLFGKSLIVTGETLDATGKQFVAVGATYKKGCDVDKSIPQKQCLSFKTFGEKFQKTFPLSVQLWEAARASNDKVMQGEVEDIIKGLSSELDDHRSASK